MQRYCDALRELGLLSVFSRMSLDEFQLSINSLVLNIKCVFPEVT